MPQFKSFIEAANANIFKGRPANRIFTVIDEANQTWQVEAHDEGGQTTLTTTPYTRLGDEPIRIEDSSVTAVFPVTVLHIGAVLKPEPEAGADRFRAEARAREVEDLAQTIRRLDGAHTLGAGALAEAIIEDGFLDRVVSNR